MSNTSGRNLLQKVYKSGEIVTRYHSFNIGMYHNKKSTTMCINWLFSVYISKKKKRKYKTQGYLYYNVQLHRTLGKSGRFLTKARKRTGRFSMILPINCIYHVSTDYMDLQLQRCYNMVMSQTNISTLHDIIIYVYWTNKRNALF